MAKKSKKESTLYYFYSTGCAFCKKIDPIVEKLNEEGYDILRLDLTDKDNQGLKREIENKYDLRCGTPWLVDASNGNHICGWRDEDTIKQWADGKIVEETPKPKTSPPPPPSNLDDEKIVNDWKTKYQKWLNENNHMNQLPNTDVMLQQLRKRKEMLERQKVDRIPVDERINTLEFKIDKLMRHLGVK